MPQCIWGVQRAASDVSIQLLLTGFAQVNWTLRFYRVILNDDVCYYFQTEGNSGDLNSHLCGKCFTIDLSHHSYNYGIGILWLPTGKYKGTNFVKNKSMVSQPIQDIIPMWSQSSSGGYLPKITEIGNQNRYLYADTHRSCIRYIWRRRNSWDVHGWMDRWT